MSGRMFKRANQKCNEKGLLKLEKRLPGDVLRSRKASRQKVTKTLAKKF